MILNACSLFYSIPVYPAGKKSMREGQKFEKLGKYFGRVSEDSNGTPVVALRIRTCAESRTVDSFSTDSFSRSHHVRKSDFGRISTRGKWRRPWITRRKEMSLLADSRKNKYFCLRRVWVFISHFTEINFHAEQDNEALEI